METSAPLLVAHHSAKKCLDSFCDEVSLFFQGKVPRIEQVKLSFWQITLICFCSLYGEERIVLSNVVHAEVLTTKSGENHNLSHNRPPSVVLVAELCAALRRNGLRGKQTLAQNGVRVGP